jgi:hypothetical protein
MDILLGVRDRPDPAIHRHAGKPIGVEPGNLLLRLEELDHTHRGFVHRLVQVGVLEMRDQVFRRLLGRAFHVFLVAHVLRIEAMDAFLDIDDLRDTAIGNAGHQFLGLISRDAALLAKEFDGLRLGLRPSFVQVLVEAHGDP